MPLKKLTLKPGTNQENTRYTNENGWWSSDKVRFRQGTPERIGGWSRISPAFFLGVCRSLWNWVTLGGANLLGVGTNLKFYIELGGSYYDITPLRSTATLNGPFTAVTTSPYSSIVTVTDVAHGCYTGDFVTFSDAEGLGGNITAELLNAEFEVTVVDEDTYTIVVGATSDASDTGNGGTAVVAEYQISTGAAIGYPLSGWGSGPWGAGPWGEGSPSVTSIRLWAQSNFGEDLVFGFRGGPLYYWSNTGGINTRGVLVSSLAGAEGVPIIQNYLMVSDVSRFVFAFGCNDYGETAQNPMLLRWSDQENLAQWTPTATNQAGSLLLSKGSKIVTALQTRQEVLVFTDAAVYSLQYLAPPIVWGSQLLVDNISIAGPNAVTTASGIVYWMGIDKFYRYDGRAQTLNCDLRQYIYDDINLEQADQIFASTNEGYNEVWFFYCSKNSETIDRYVVFNYLENNGAGVWYYGSMARTAWIDSSLRSNPMAATYINNIVYHEDGVDDNSTDVPLPISSFISSSEFDIDDGDHFGFVWRILPDITFRGSTTENPEVTMTLIPMQNSGSGYNNPQSVSSTSDGVIVRSATFPIEKFTGQINVRVRGRQMILQVESNQLGCRWQLGSPRIDIRQDGRRGNS